MNKKLIQRSIFSFLLVLILISFGCTGVHKDQKTKDIPKGDYKAAEDYLTKYIKKQMKKKKVIGLSIAVVDGTEVIYKKGFGYADKKNKIPVTTETIFRVGSISKVFTVTGAMQLHEQGRLDIDKPLKNYIPNFFLKSRFSDAPVVTPRMIMTHHSGIPSDLFKDMKAMNPPSYEELIESLHSEYYACQPNVILAYSNLAMTILGYAIEKVSGQDFVSYIDSNILEPLDMKNSSFELKSHMMKLYAKGYIGKKEVGQFGTFAVPAGLLYSNADDMGNFIISILNGGEFNGKRILKSETLNEMTRQQNTDIVLDKNTKIGLGWFLISSKLEYAGKVIQHGGDWEDFHAQMTLLPDHNLGIIVMTNSSTGSGVVRKVAVEGLRIFLEAKEGLKPPEEKEEEKLKKVKIDSSKYKEYEGYYAITSGMGAFKFEVINNKLQLSAMKFKLLLVPHPDDWFTVNLSILKIFRMKIKDLGILGFRKLDKYQVLMQKVKDKEYLFAIKVDPKPVSEVWINREGDYEVVNLGNGAELFPGFSEIFKLKTQDGILLLGGVHPLQPISDTEAYLMGYGRNKGDMVRIEEIDGEEYLFFSGFQLKKKE